MIMLDLVKTINTIAKHQSDVLESLRNIETICTNFSEFVEDLDINHCLDTKEMWVLEDKLLEIRKQLKASFSLQESTDLRIQKLIQLVK